MSTNCYCGIIEFRIVKKKKKKKKKKFYLLSIANDNFANTVQYCFNKRNKFHFNCNNVLLKISS